MSPIDRPCRVLTWSAVANRVAIATADGVSVADHLARSAAFLVVDLETGARETRQRAADACGNHRSFVDLAAGCGAVICGGVGQGAVNALAAHGINCLVLAGPMAIEDAFHAHAAGTLATTDERVCLC
jgi:predicted Fe-Mo cluster-binding NifX family protein